MSLKEKRQVMNQSRPPKQKPAATRRKALHHAQGGCLYNRKQDQGREPEVAGGERAEGRGERREGGRMGGGMGVSPEVRDRIPKGIFFCTRRRAAAGRRWASSREEIEDGEGSGMCHLE
jgi:hypothetical protein